MNLTEIPVEISCEIANKTGHYQELDWETMNKLCDLNKKFERFIQDIKIDFDSKRIHKSEYDEIIPNPNEYCEKLLKKES